MRTTRVEDHNLSETLARLRAKLDTCFSDLPRCDKQPFCTEYLNDDEVDAEIYFANRHWSEVCNGDEICAHEFSVGLLSVTSYLRLLPGLLYVSSKSTIGGYENEGLGLNTVVNGSLYHRIDPEEVRRVYQGKLPQLLDVLTDYFLLQWSHEDGAVSFQAVGAWAKKMNERGGLVMGDKMWVCDVFPEFGACGESPDWV